MARKRFGFWRDRPSGLAFYRHTDGKLCTSSGPEPGESWITVNWTGVNQKPVHEVCERPHPTTSGT